MKAHVYWNLIKIFLIGSYSLYFTLPLELGTHREKIKKEMCLWFSHIEHKCSTPITVFKKGRCNWSGRFQLSPSCLFPNWLFLLPNPLSNKRSWSCFWKGWSLFGPWSHSFHQVPFLLTLQPLLFQNSASGLLPHLLCSMLHTFNIQNT